MTNNRVNPIEIEKEEFRKVGHRLIDDISDFISSIDEKTITTKESPSQLQDILGNTSLPQNGMPLTDLITKASDLLFNHSLLNGHPKFLGYITSSAAPIGALGDLLTASINPNVGAHILSPMATEIEKQTVQWLAELIGVSQKYGGILVSGGSMANFTAFLAARTAKLSRKIKQEGLSSIPNPPIIYCSKTTHTWIDKAASLFGFGTKSVRWIQTDSSNRMNTEVLEKTIKKDMDDGCHPIMVIGTAGDVSTGVVDDLKGIAKICKTFDLWFHIDGAYGVPAAIVPKYKDLFNGLTEADSIALDPHKWLYSPLEAGCTLVKNPQHLIDTFSSHPEYYNFGKSKDGFTLNFYEYGLQNSRGFRALKVWLSLQQMGRNGYQKLINEDIELSEMLFDRAQNHPELEAVSQNLSITTLRFIPPKCKEDNEYLNVLNKELLNGLQTGGKLFLSNAIVDEMYCLRACFVNFRTTKKDIAEIIQIIIKEGNKTHFRLKKQNVLE